MKKGGRGFFPSFSFFFSHFFLSSGTQGKFFCHTYVTLNYSLLVFCKSFNIMLMAKEIAAPQKVPKRERSLSICYIELGDIWMGHKEFCHNLLGQ